MLALDWIGFGLGCISPSYRRSSQCQIIIDNGHNFVTDFSEQNSKKVWEKCSLVLLEARSWFQVIMSWIFHYCNPTILSVIYIHRFISHPLVHTIRTSFWISLPLLIFFGAWFFPVQECWPKLEQKYEPIHNCAPGCWMQQLHIVFIFIHMTIRLNAVFLPFFLCRTCWLCLYGWSLISVVQFDCCKLQPKSNNTNWTEWKVSEKRKRTSDSHPTIYIIYMIMMDSPIEMVSLLSCE